MNEFLFTNPHFNEGYMCTMSQGGFTDRTMSYLSTGPQHAAVAIFQPVACVDLCALFVLLAEFTHCLFGFLPEALASQRVPTATGSPWCDIRDPGVL